MGDYVVGVVVKVVSKRVASTQTDFLSELPPLKLLQPAVHACCQVHKTENISLVSLHEGVESTETFLVMFKTGTGT